MKSYATFLRCAAALIVMAACGAALLVAQEGTLPSGGAACRRAVRGGVQGYFKKVVQVYAVCHRYQMAGKLPAFPTLDCNDASTWAGGGYQRGVDKIARVTSQAFLGLGEKCEALSASAPDALGYELCPAPCASLVPVVAGFDDVATCVHCLTDRCIAAAVAETYGSPPLAADRSQRSLLACQARIGRELAGYGHGLLKLLDRCQYNQDRGRNDWSGFDCRALDLAVHPFHDKAERLTARLDKGLARACGDGTPLGSLDSCADAVASEQMCVRTAAEQCAVSLHQPMAAPTPTPSATPTPVASPTFTATPAADGLGCFDDGQCSSGFCVDGVCCESRCDSGCLACSAAKTGGSDGICAPVVGNTDPDGECADSACTIGSCDGSGLCQFTPLALGASCGDSATQCRNGDTCDGAGNCVDNGFVAAGFSCGQGASACSGQDTCNGSGACVANDLPAGTVCGDTGDECTIQDTCDGSGSCVDQGFAPVNAPCGDPAATTCSAADRCDGRGRCRDNDLPLGTACGGEGECIAEGTCNGDGVCLASDFEPAGTPCGDGSDSACDRADTCDGAGGCLQNLSAAGSACGDPGNACVRADSCDGSGSCTANGFAAAGTACADDGNPCTNDVCDASGACTHVNNFHPCDDGVFCNGADTCSGGSCSVHDGDPCSGADGDANCSETCDEASASCSAPDPVGSSCDDGLFCNGTEGCNAAGACVGNGDVPCASGGFFGGDDDGDCRESCDELTNSCTAPDPDGTPCNDALFCSGGDVGNLCVGDGDCSSGVCELVCSGRDAGKPCSDDSECRNGGCDAHACAAPEYSVGGSAIVLAQDSCKAGQCVGGAPPCPGDAVDGLGRGIGLSASCADACDEASESCTAQAADDIDCSDDNFCNGNSDSCQTGACQRSGDPCADLIGNANTDCSESCVDTTSCNGFGCIGAGSCTAPDPIGSSCSDGVFCTTTDTCDGAGTCQGSGDPCAGLIGDGDADCSESCREGSGTFVCDAPDPAGGSCLGNGVTPCSGADVCDGVGGCDDQDLAPETLCGDLADNECTAPDTCNDSGQCLEHNVLDGTACGSPGDECTRGDSCQAGACMTGGFELEGTPCGADDPDDLCDVQDTCDGLGACEEQYTDCVDPDPSDCIGVRCDASGECVQEILVGQACDDGLFCTLSDVCDASGQCVGNPNSTPCDGLTFDPDDCTRSCDETTDSCTAADQDNTPCSDGLFCSGAETCQNGACVSPGDPCTGPDGDGDCTETCDEAADNCNGNDPISPCDDGFLCNGSDRCVAGSCLPIGPGPCDQHINDGDSDCSETCDPATGECTLPDPIGRLCADAFPAGSGRFLPYECRAARCDGTGFCNQDAADEPIGTPCIDLDGPGTANQCRIAQCAAGGVCNQAGAFAPSGTTCDDGLFCTLTDTCTSAGSCTGTGDPCAGSFDDGDDDCNEACNESTDDCTAYDGDARGCNDGDYCNGADQCRNGTCSNHQGNPCADTVANCSDRCVDGPGFADGHCNGHEPNGTVCATGANRKVCSNGTCKDCGGFVTSFSIDSVGQDDEWPGGGATRNDTVAEDGSAVASGACYVTVSYPTGSIRQNTTDFVIESFNGYDVCFITRCDESGCPNSSWDCDLEQNQTVADPDCNSNANVTLLIDVSCADCGGSTTFPGCQ